MAEAGFEQRVAAVRRFNRFYTQKIGVLQDGLLNSPFSLTETRVLYELAHRERPTASELGRDLGLDAGYLSRILRSFEQKSLVKKAPSPADGRQLLLTLTRKGEEAFAPLNVRCACRDRRADRYAAGLPAEAPDRRDAHDRGLLGARPEPKAPYCCGRTSPATWAGSSTATASSMRRNTAGTRRSRRWSRNRRGSSSRTTTRKASAAGSPRRTARSSARCSWSASRATVAKLRLLYVEPKARGLGIGARLVDECERFARQAGYKKIDAVDATASCIAARHIYEKAGYRLVARNRTTASATTWSARRGRRSCEYPRLAAAAATGVQVGAAMVATRFVVEQTDPASLAMLRYIIGFLFLLPAVLLSGQHMRFARRDVAPIALLGIAQFGILVALLNFGLRHLRRRAAPLSSRPSRC